MLLNGKWQHDWHPFQGKSTEGRFERQKSQVRHFVTTDGTAGPTGAAGFRAEAGRYHLYAALICPWASRTLMARTLLGLEEAISVSIVSPVLTAEGWAFDGFDGATDDPVLGAQHMHEVYTRAMPHYTGRATVPVLFDKREGLMVNNESADILRMLSTGFAPVLAPGRTLYPQALAAEIDALSAQIYEPLNNGVYRAGFARSQAAYDEAVRDVFAALDALDARLAAGGGPYLFGGEISETDIRLFVTLVRFDPAYHGLFKCNLRRLADYPALAAYQARLLALPGVAETANITHIKAGYYSIKALNPTGVVPMGPA